MSTAADYAFALAYKCWLDHDSYFAKAVAGGGALDRAWVREIGRPYLIDRTIPKGRESDLASLVLRSGQGNDMPIEHRAARLAFALDKWKSAGAKAPVSATTKLSWFVWPRGWTMYDSLASRAVLGSPKEHGIERMELFYAALALRGWDDTLTAARRLVSAGGQQPELAERTLDKYLFLLGSDTTVGDAMTRRIDGFLNALPVDLRDSIVGTGEALGELLAPLRLAHRDTATDRAALRHRVEELRKFKREIA